MMKFSAIKKASLSGLPPKALLFLVAPFVIFAAVAGVVVQPKFFAGTDLMIYDRLLPFRAEKTITANPEIIIVDIDEASTKAFGQWPWPRHHIASLIDRLTDYRVGAIGLDILFVEADRTSPARLAESLPRDRALSFRYSFAPEKFSDYDRMLAASLERHSALREDADQGRAVIAAFALGSSEGGASPPPPVHAFFVRNQGGITDWKSLMPASEEAVLPLPVLGAVADIGFINADVDIDGITRKIPLVYRFGEHIYPAMSVSVLMSYFGSGAFMLQSGPYGLEAIDFAGISARISPDGRLLIPFVGGRGTYTYVSAVDVINGTLPREKLEGSIVLVGSTLTALADIRATPRDPTHPGVEIQAAAIDTLLTGNAIVIPHFAWIWQMAFVVLAGMPLVLFCLKRPVLHAVTAAVVLAVMVVLSICFFRAGFFISALYGAMAWVTLSIFGGLLWLLRYRAQWREEERKKRMLSRYSSAKVVETITESTEDLAMGRNQEVSIMFSDIRGFTAMSKDMQPEKVVDMLNRYFKEMLDLVEKHSGTTDKLIGDALMAYWNAPGAVPGHYIKAVAAAIDMQEELAGFNETQKEMNQQPIRVSIGVHMGDAFSGNMGSEDFATYTVIGDSVNLASRLASLSSQYETGIVVSEAVKNKCGDVFFFQYLDRATVKGRDDLPVTIYTPMRPEEAKKRSAELALWDRAREHYAAGDFEAARESLVILCRNHPETGLYGVFAKRVDNYLQNPPEEWKDIFAATEK